MAARHKTGHVGIYWYEQPRIGGPGVEKVFYAVFKMNGKVYEEPVGRQYRDGMTAAKAARARAALIEGRKELARNRREREKAEKDAEANRPTIARLWTLYKEHKPGLKGIVTDENRFQRHIAPRFADKTPEEIDPLSIDRLRVSISKKLSAKTTANTLELLRRIINYGVSRNLCTSTLKIRLPKVDNLRTEDLNADELAKLLDVLDTAENQAVANIMRMALYTGLRRGEILKLQWLDLDFERNFISLKNPKGGQSAKVPMSPQAKALLQSLPRESGFVFPGRGGNQRVEVRRAARKLCDAAGLPKDFRPMHGLRHAFASMVASSGEVPMYVLQRLLTHKSAAMTQRYAHLRDEALQHGAGVAGDIIQNAQNGEVPAKVVNLEDFRKE